MRPGGPTRRRFTLFYGEEETQGWGEEREIEGKVVAITGASSGIGETTARHLAALGAMVVLGARRLERLEVIAAEINAAGGKAKPFAMDVTKQADVDAFVAGAVQAFGKLDMLVNNAGDGDRAALGAKDEEWDRMIDINIKGLLYGVAAALPVFQKQGSGHFINISSVAGLKVFSPGGTVYSGTKFAVAAISEGLRHEVGDKNSHDRHHARRDRHGIEVGHVGPGEPKIRQRIL